uniref:Transmembrane protein 107 n=1 Tax=Rhabditophanes sp. KR3021 TaxID=114890 RepID=A0AC35UDI2_9BILA
MSTMNFIPSVFLAITAHACMMVTLIYNKDTFIQNSIPQSEATNAELYGALSVSFSINVGLSITFLLLELILLFRTVYSFFVNIFLLISHTISTAILVKFTFDQHPIYHFWILFIFSSMPTFLTLLAQFAKEISFKTVC